MPSKLESLIIGDHIEYEDEESRLHRKLDDAHNHVLDLYKQFGINIGPVNIIVAPQNLLKKIEQLEMHQLDSSFDPYTYIRGMYSRVTDAILLDKEVWRYRNQQVIEHVLAHEYAHRLYTKYMGAVQHKIFPDKNTWLKSPRPELKALPGPKLEGEELEKAILEQINKKIENMKKEKRNELEKRRLEFEIYFEEMFAESVALYLTEQTDQNGDSRWFDYSRMHWGKVFGKDKDFAMKMERLLYTVFFDKMFSHGLKKISMLVPILYQDARDLFEKRYRKALERPVICL